MTKPKFQLINNIVHHLRHQGVHDWTIALYTKLVYYLSKKKNIEELTSSISLKYSATDCLTYNVSVQIHSATFYTDTVYIDRSKTKLSDQISVYKNHYISFQYSGAVTRDGSHYQVYAANGNVEVYHKCDIIKMLNKELLENHLINIFKTILGYSEKQLNAYIQEPKAIPMPFSPPKLKSKVCQLNLTNSEEILDADGLVKFFVQDVFDVMTQSKTIEFKGLFRLDSEEHILPTSPTLIINEHLLYENPDATVYIVDDPMLALKNQKHTRAESEVYICFVGEISKKATQVLQGRKVILIANNHSGTSLGEAIIKSQMLATELSELGLAPYGFRIVEVSYLAPERIFLNLDAANQQIEGAEIVFDEFFTPEGFFDVVVKVTELMSPPQKPWLTPSSESQPSSPMPLNAVDDNKVPMLIYPIIPVASLILKYGIRGVGKTSVAMVIAVSVITETNPFPGYNWANSISTRKKGVIRKVAIIRSEMSDAQNNTRFNEFVKPILSSNTKKHEQQEANYLMDKLSMDLTTEEGHRALLQYLKDAKQRGCNDEPLSLIVLDNLQGFCGGKENSHTWPKIKPLIDKIRAMEITVMLIVHANQDGSIKGWQEKENDADVALKVFRKDDEKGTLALPFSVSASGKLRDGIIAKDYEDVELVYTPGKGIHAYSKELSIKELEQKNFKEAASQLEQSGLPTDDVANLLGVSSATYFRNKKK